MPTPRRISPGTRLGHYDVERLIGEGGMGTVYAARDTRLQRTVAIKVLHDGWDEAQSRFMREAHAAAALQHPHICALHDIGTQDGIEYLVLEYLDGERLRVPLPLPRVIEYGAQLADALDAAHSKHIIHRDLKPSNVLLTKSGVKVLDFGVARINGDDTLTHPGARVGTPAYMAPEQLAGLPTDARTDIYALGRLLIEMATGRNDPAGTSGHRQLDAVILGCLADNPDDRWQSARDVRRLLQSIDLSPPALGPVAARLRWWRTAAMALLAVSAALAVSRFWTAPEEGPAFHLRVAPPPGSAFLVARNREGGVALSPDGTQLAFVARTGVRVQLWLQRLDAGEARPLDGTDDAFYPFWSPDSRQIAFFTPDSLKTVSIDGGPVRTVSVSEPRATGGAWLDNDVLLVTGVGPGIRRISARGGESHLVVDGAWPQAVPGTRAFLFSSETAILAASLDAPDVVRQLVETEIPHAAYSRGHLLFVRDRTLLAQPFDSASLTLSGEAFVVATGLLVNRAGTPATHISFSASPGGQLVYAAGDALSRLRWRDRNGTPLASEGGIGEYQTARLSPDGARVAFARIDNGNMDIWIAELGRPAARVTFEPTVEQFPIWSPDGRSLTFAAGLGNAFDLFRTPADGSGVAEQLTHDKGPQHPMDWSDDGRYLAFTRNQTGYGTDLRILAIDDSGRQPYEFLKTVVSEAHTQFAPGTPPRWVAYSADDSGRREIYVRAFTPGHPASGARWQVSTDGGTTPRWRGDGRELFYWGLNGRMMSVAVDGGGAAFRSAPPIALFEVHRPPLRTNAIEFDVTRDGQRFLIIEPSEQTLFQTLSLVTNWLPRN
jgi:hypothetical protein